jgi:hypothetical protein
MLHLVKTERIYPPVTVAAMTIAFDHACASIPTSARTDDARRRLAAIILRHADDGVREPERLTELALREFAASTDRYQGRAATG